MVIIRRDIDKVIDEFGNNYQLVDKKIILERKDSIDSDDDSTSPIRRKEHVIENVSFEIKDNL